MEHVTNTNRRYANQAPTFFTAAEAAEYVEYKKHNPQYDWTFVIVENFENTGLCIIDVYDSDNEWVGHVAEPKQPKSAYVPKNESDDLNPDFLFTGIANDLLVAIAAGQIDPVELAKKTLANRGFNEQGKWVGFNKTGASSSHDVFTKSGKKTRVFIPNK